MTHSEDVKPVQSDKKPPNYIIGFLLNIIFPGIGFTYINLSIFQAACLVLYIMIAILITIVAAEIYSKEAIVYSALAILSIAMIAQLVFYHTLYQKQARQNFSCKISTIKKWVFWAVQIPVIAFCHILLLVTITSEANYVLKDQNYVKDLHLELKAKKIKMSETYEECPNLDYSLTSMKLRLCRVDISEPENITIYTRYSNGEEKKFSFKK